MRGSTRTTVIVDRSSTFRRASAASTPSLRVAITKYST
jgi:hypothetical protein